MSERQGTTGPPEDVGPAASRGAHRPDGDPAAVLLAVERLGADVAALGRALAAHPEELAARLDVDSSTAALGVRIGALGSALDQLRLSLLAALDRTAERLDAPVWLPELESAVAELARPPEGPPWLPGLHVALADVGSRLDAPLWLPDLRRALSALPEPVLDALSTLAIGTRLDEVSGTVRRLADDPRLDELAATVRRLGDDRRLDAVATAVGRLMDDRRLDAVAAAVDRLGDDRRLDAVVAAVLRLADDERLDDVVAAVGRLEADQRLDQLTATVARLADDERLDQLNAAVARLPDRLSAIASQVDRITPLARAGDQAGTLFDRLDHVGGALVEVLDLLRAREAEPADDDDDERFEGVVDLLAGVTRRQDDVAARLDRIDAELRRSRGEGSGASADALGKPDTGTSRALDVVTDVIQQQERVLAFRLDRIDAELKRLRQAPTAAGPDVASDALEAVLDRLARQEQAVASHLGWFGERLTEVAAHLVPDDAGGAAARRDDERFEAVVAQLATAVRRQEELASAFSEADIDDRSPMAVTAVFDRMEQRERSIAARLDRIDAELRRLDPGAAPVAPAVAEPEGGLDAGAGSLAESVGAIASITEDLARLIEATAERLDRRLARVESSLGATAERPPPVVPARPSVSPEAAALRLAELRAERAQIQARLQEERLLAARTREDGS